MTKKTYPNNSLLLMRVIGVFVLGSIILFACQPGKSTSIADSNATADPNDLNSSTVQLTKPSSLTPIPTIIPNLLITPDSLNGTQIQFWHPWSGNSAEEIEKLVEKFNNSNEWAIKVEIHTPGSSGELFNEVDVNSDVELLPDVVVASIEHLRTWEVEQKDIIVDLNGYLHSQEWGLSDEEIANIPVVYWDKSQDEEKLLGFPAQRTVQVLFYNQSWAQELGFSDAPKSPEDFKEQTCAASKANMSDENFENDGTGGWIISSDPLILLSWVNTFGDPGLPIEESDKYKFNTPIFNDSIKYLYQLFDENCSWSSRNPQPYEYFATRQALFYSGTLQDIAVQERTQTRLENNDNWTVIPYPSQDQKQMVILNGPSYAILRSSYTEQMASWVFIKWLSQSENEAKIVEFSTTLPVSLSTSKNLESFGKAHPQWQQTLSWVPLLKPAPQLSSWRVVRNLLQDAMWQIFYTNVTLDQIPSVLEQLDAMIPEILNYKEE